MGKDDSPISYYFRDMLVLIPRKSKEHSECRGQPLQVAELPKAGFTEKVVPPKYIPPEINAKATMIIDASDGDIIYQYNENEAFAPASMSKMMTAYLLLESIHNGKVRWEDPVK